MRILIAIIFGAILLTGCAQDDESTPEFDSNDVAEAFSPADTSSNIDQSTREQAFVSVLRANYPMETPPDDAFVIEMGYTVCSALASGMTGQQVSIILSEDLSIGLSGFLVGASVGALCPEYSAQVSP